MALCNLTKSLKSASPRLEKWQKVDSQRGLIHIGADQHLHLRTKDGRMPSIKVIRIRKMLAANRKIFQWSMMRTDWSRLQGYSRLQFWFWKMINYFKRGWEQPGLLNLFHPTIQDGSTWSKLGARGEHGDVFLFSNFGALWFSENLIRYSLYVCLREVKNNLFSFKHSYLRHFSWRF